MKTAKRLLSLLLALALLVAVVPAAIAATVYVTVAQDGAFMTAADGTVLARTPVTIPDGANINDAFTLLHQAHGPADGFLTENGAYGLFITRFMGVDNSSCGYYKNNGYSTGLDEKLAKNDHIVFWFYQDTTNWSDTYTAFDRTAAGVAAGKSLTLTLTAYGYSGNTPCANASILLDGAATGLVTDENGKATLSFSEKGAHLISAVPEAGSYIVPPVCVVTVGSFTDAAKHWSAETIEWALDRGLVGGYSDGTFRPDNDMTRAELCAILFREAQARGIDVSVGEDTNILSYDDALTLPQWTVPVLQWACGAGVLEPRGTRLAPNEKVTREEVAQMLYRFCGSPAEGGAMGMAGFADVSQVSAEAYGAMQWAVLSGIIQGKNGQLAPRSSATRAEILTMLHRLP